MEKVTMETIVNLCKHYGFIYQGSEIYGGLANTWDFGILGSKTIIAVVIKINPVKIAPKINKVLFCFYNFQLNL